MAACGKKEYFRFNMAQKRNRKTLAHSELFQCAANLATALVRGWPPQYAAAYLLILEQHHNETNTHYCSICSGRPDRHGDIKYCRVSRPKNNQHHTRGGTRCCRRRRFIERR